MPLTRRFMLRPEQCAAIEETRKAKQAAVPVEEELEIESVIPENPTPVKEEPVVKETVTEKEVEETVAESAEEVTTEPAEKVTEPVEEKEEEAPEPVPEKITAEPETEEKTEEPVEAEKPEPEEVVEETKKTKKTKKTTKKAETKKESDEPEIIHVRNNLKEGQELSEAVNMIVQTYTDTAFDEFKENIEEDLKRTVFDERADAGIIRIVLSNLSRCFDNVTREYARVNTQLEQLTNKTYGLIPRQITLNSNGFNEASRKQAGVHAPEIYKTKNGKVMNLYAVQAALEAEAIYLQMIMKQLEFKRSTLIAYLTAHKVEAGIIGD